MKDKEPKKGSLTPIKGTFPDAGKIKCKDCKYRDRTVVKIAGKEKALGITKDSCKQYSVKPLDILFYNADCEKYHKEE